MRKISLYIITSMYVCLAACNTGVSLDRSALTMGINGTAELTAKVADKTVTWSSDNENVVTVEDGVVCAVAAGTATITASADDSGKKAVCVVTVIDFVVTDKDILVTNADEWDVARMAVRDAAYDQNCTIYIHGNVTVEGSTDNTFGTASGRIATLKGDGTLSLSGSGNLLRVGADQTVIVDSKNLTLQGARSNDNSVVHITGSGSSFTMNSGKISGNIYDYSYTADGYPAIFMGGGVYVGDGGTFTMNGGEVSDNTTGSGGGVCVLGGTFIMNGGKVSGNTANSGGGVYAIGGKSTFTMTGGEVSGNTADAGGGVMVGGSFIMRGGRISGNTANSGGGVYVMGKFYIETGTIYGRNGGGLSNTAGMGAALYNGGIDERTECRTFGGSTENRSGHLSSTNDTIMVLNGLVQGTDPLVASGREIGAVADIAAQTWQAGNALDLAPPPIFLAPGHTATAQGWQISDTADGSNGWSDFTPPVKAEMACNRKYLRYYATISGGSTVYSNTVTIRVYSETPREVTVEMYDSGNDGWNDEGALRITVNRIQIANDVRVQTTAADNTPPGQSSANTYTFFVDKGDRVDIFWTVKPLSIPASNRQYHNSFIVYYTDTPPDPPFFTGSLNGMNLVGPISWSGANALLYKLLPLSNDHTGRDYLTDVANKTWLGSFTVR